jgi:anti-sigma regulatory factor (Ser/Thr protein kinase)
VTSSAHLPASLRVYRYRPDDGRLETVVGDGELPLPEPELIRLAQEAITQRTFVAHAAAEEDGSELCFVPQDDRCEVLTIRAKVRRRHHGDHRRSLMEILNDLAAALACGRLRFLDDAELAEELPPDGEVLSVEVADSAALAAARGEIGRLLDAAGFSAERRDETVLCVSEAATNALVHGGGRGRLLVRPAPGGVRFVVSDDGTGLSFLNWIEATGRGQASMGYGYHIILDHIDDVSLHTCPTGTTLILDQQATSPEVAAC